MVTRQRLLMIINMAPNFVIIVATNNLAPVGARPSASTMPITKIRHDFCFHKRLAICDFEYDFAGQIWFIKIDQKT